MDIKLLNPKALEKYNWKYNYLHFGIVQIGTKPLSREGLDISLLICLRVSRFLDFNDSLLGIVETNLRSGPIYFDRFPNYTLSLKDIDILDSFTLNVKTFNYKTKIGSLPVTIIYRIHYKAMSLTFNTGAMRSSYKGETVLFKIDMQRSHLLVPKTISWSQVSLSQNRLLQDTTLVEKLENTRVSQIQQFSMDVCVWVWWCWFESEVTLSVNYLSRYTHHVFFSPSYINYHLNIRSLNK